MFSVLKFIGNTKCRIIIQKDNSRFLNAFFPILIHTPDIVIILF